MTLDPLQYIRVEEGEPYGKYILSPPDISEVERRLIDIIGGVFRAEKSLSMVDLGFLGDKRDDFVTLLRDTISKIRPKHIYSSEELLSIAGDLYEDLKLLNIDSPYVSLKAVFDGLGFGDLEFLLLDEKLEDIMVNGYNQPVFVYHVKYGHLETNIRLGEDLKRIYKKLYSYFRTNNSYPYIDGHLPDGSRVNVVSDQVSEKGPSITIRKFRRQRLDILQIIRAGTMNVELAAYLWLMVEGLGAYPQNLVVAGNTGGGKTTTLNALVDLIPLNERIITIEDTREVSLLHPDWVALSTERDSLNLNDLLVTALRMRPDRIIVGEVRGEEAETLLAAMNVGHRGMGTLHANSARDTIRRLVTPPMNVPREMLPVLGIIVVQHRLKLPGKGVVRRVTEVVELSPLEGGINITPVFRWNPSSDRIERTQVPSSLLDRFSEYMNVDKSEINKELIKREKILKFALNENLNRAGFVSLINTYYVQPEKIERVLG